MYNLFEYQAGFHRLALGFPSIDGCNAICLQTKGGLYGVHVLGCNEFNSTDKKMENMATGFASFVTNHPFGNEGFVNLFSVCFHKKRGWNAGKGFADELGVYAAKLGYTGTVTTFDLSKVKKWPRGQGTSTSDSAYVEFRRVFDKVEILYKPWQQCTPVPAHGLKASDLAGPDYQGIEPTTGVVSSKFRFPQAARKVTANGSSFVLSPATARVGK
jgi:hypothetical protein